MVGVRLRQSRLCDVPMGVDLQCYIYIDLQNELSVIYFELIFINLKIV